MRRVIPLNLETPVLFLLFNRPETTQKVFDVLRRAKPTKLFISADGPRPHIASDAEKCARAREIISQVDWDCEIHTRFLDTNVGCRIAVSSGISWFFETVEEGIILEDDVLPHLDFFRFCQELLAYYRADERFMLISGDNFQFGRRRNGYSYYFSRYAHIWGWATWRRAWQKYDVDMKLWPEIRDDGWLYDIFADHSSILFWKKILNDVFDKKIDTWDYQLNFACWLNNSLSIIPNVNLASNIGFGTDALHTKEMNRLAGIPVEPIDFPLRHPDFILRDARADAFTASNQFSVQPPWHAKIYHKLSKLL
jgi:hypothetical protein